MKADTWRVASSEKVCRRCERPFKEKEVFFSALGEEQDEFVRHDFCDGCWTGEGHGTFFSFWKTRRQGEQRKARLDTNVALDLFCQLAGADTEKKSKFRFVLALCLARQKVIKLIGSRRRDGREVVLFQVRKNEDPIEMENPELADEEIEEVTAQLKELLQADL